MPAVVTSMIHPRAKRLGDMAAGTVVVTQRARLSLTPPPTMPPALAHWAAAADVAALPSGLTVAVRQFLARAPGLSPQSRHTLGVELLHATLPHVSPPPPGGFHPEVVLAAVVAERRRRDVQRLWREDQLRARVLPVDPFSQTPADPRHPRFDSRLTRFCSPVGGPRSGPRSGGSAISRRRRGQWAAPRAA